ncbi:hypothetical protein [Tenacibaculum mesophilum]|uniref:hypothetical protein n=1 Tax=Tenacibaculum mesophilum TaxID=104268 RepID=UPI0024938BE8|nr:hypothetical protein [Tenacibaculum mesophilum]
MQFFEFYVNTFQWKAVLQQGKQLRKVFIPIDNEEWVQEENYPVKMDLVDAYHDLSLWKGETTFMDVVEWSNDFTIGGLTHKAGAFMLMTGKVKEVLEKYNLPPHRFYPTEVYCKRYKETRDDYYLFHMTGEGLYGDDYVDYLKCTFVEYKRDFQYNKIQVKIHPEGVVNSLESYNEITFGEGDSFLGSYTEKIANGEMKEKRNGLDFLNKVYKHDYDVLWGISNTIYISEAIKEELEKVGVSCGSFFPITHNMIRAFEYKQMKNS